MEKIKVLVVDDQKELAEEIGSVLSSDPELAFIGTAADGFDALEKIAQNTPDVVLLDIRMPNMNGVVATQRIKAEYPNVKVVILTTFDDSDYILNAINNGASGYLLKDLSGNMLIDAVKNAHAGDTILPAKIARRIADAAKHVAADREIDIGHGGINRLEGRRSHIFFRHHDVLAGALQSRDRIGKHIALDAVFDNGWVKCYFYIIIN